MGSVLLLNAAGSAVVIGLWIAAVVHVYRSLAADEALSSSLRRCLLTDPEVIRVPDSPERSAIAR